MGWVAAKIMGYEGVWLTRGMGYEGVDCIPLYCGQCFPSRFARAMSTNYRLGTQQGQVVLLQCDILI